MGISLDTVLARLPPGTAEEYLRRILQHLFDVGSDSYVRLAAGADTPPNYRIEMIMDEETGQPGHFGEFSGKTHRELTVRQRERASWFEEVSHRPAVQQLIGEVRKQARR